MLLFLVAVVMASATAPARLKKQIIFFFALCLAVASAGIIAPLVAEDDGSYWPGKYDVRELSPALGALPDGVAVRTALPAVHALPALAAPYHYPYLI